MRINSSSAPSSAAIAGVRRRSEGSGQRFAVAQPAAPEAASVRAGVGLGGIEALVALQRVEEDGASRRQAVRQGQDVLDLLDEIKLALLSGTVSAGALSRLERAVTQPPPLAGDPRLNDVLVQIDLRARVELAKLRHRAL